MKNKPNTRINALFVNTFLVRKMRIFFLFFTTLFFSLFIQEVKAQDYKINLALSNVTLNEAIKAVEQNTKYVFFYNNSLKFPTP